MPQTSNPAMGRDLEDNSFRTLDFCQTWMIRKGRRNGLNMKSRAQYNILSICVFSVFAHRLRVELSTTIINYSFIVCG